MEEKKKILIIDDNPDFADAVKVTLETGGPYVAKVVNSAEEAVEKLEEELPDLMILDIIMQEGAEGIILSRKFKKDARLKNVPIIMLTSITKQTGFKFNKNDLKDKKFLPVDEFMEKPVPPQQLLLRVEKLISLAVSGNLGGERNGQATRSQT